MHGKDKRAGGNTNVGNDSGDDDDDLEGGRQ